MHYWAVSCSLHEVTQTRVKEKGSTRIGGTGCSHAPLKRMTQGEDRGLEEAHCQGLLTLGAPCFWPVCLWCVTLTKKPHGSNPGLLHCVVDSFLSEPSGKPHVWATWYICGKMSMVCCVWGWNTGSDECLWVNCHEVKQAQGSLLHILSTWESPLLCPPTVSPIPTHPPVPPPPPALQSLCTQPSDASSLWMSPGERTRWGQEGGSWALEWVTLPTVAALHSWRTCKFHGGGTTYLSAKLRMWWSAKLSDAREMHRTSITHCLHACNEGRKLCNSILSRTLYFQR